MEWMVVIRRHSMKDLIKHDSKKKRKRKFNFFFLIIDWLIHDSMMITDDKMHEKIFSDDEYDDEEASNTHTHTQTNSKRKELWLFDISIVFFSYIYYRLYRTIFKIIIQTFDMAIVDDFVHDLCLSVCVYVFLMITNDGHHLYDWSKKKEKKFFFSFVYLFCSKH